MKATALKNPEICIIGGFPRAGTRQVADVLNAHKNVRILSEVFAKAFRKAADMMEASDERHRNHRSEEPYYATRTLAVLNVLAVIQKKGYKPFSFDGLTVVGFKKPLIELQKESMDILFPERKIKFIYCCRNLADSFLSNKSVFGWTAERYVRNTTQSLQGLRLLVEDGRYSLSIFDLDAFVRHENRAQYVATNVLQPVLGQDCVTQDDAERLLGATTNRNATSAKEGKTRLTELTGDEIQLFRSAPEFRSNLDWFRDSFGIDLFNI